jgi:hypothetical protein
MHPVKAHSVEVRVSNFKYNNFLWVVAQPI